MVGESGRAIVAAKVSGDLFVFDGRFVVAEAPK